MATLNSGLQELASVILSMSWPVFPISMSWLDGLPTAVSGKFSERGCVMAGERIRAWGVMVTVPRVGSLV